jgi:hypothetical protein
MSKRRKTLLLFAGLLLVFGIYMVFIRGSEPTYKGKRLSYWFGWRVGPMSWGTAVATHSNPKKEEVVRALGTNALPTALRWLQTKPSRLPYQLNPLLDRQPFVKYRFHVGDRAYDGVRVFQILGPEARPAMPELIRLFGRKETCHYAAQCLVTIGPDGIALVCAGLTDRDQSVVKSCLEGLWYAGSNGVVAVPGLLDRLKDKDPAVRGSAANALRRIGQQPEVVVPALIGALADPDYEVKAHVLLALEECGRQASNAIPAIQRLLAETNRPRWIDENAQNALRSIKTGVPSEGALRK